MNSMIFMAAKYQVYKDVAGKFRFRLRSADDRIVVVSEAYEQHASALNGVKSIQNNCTVGIEDLTVEGTRMPYPKYQVFMDAASKFRFRLTASNGQIIGASEAYESKESCLDGIKVMQESCDAEIEDLSMPQKPASAESVGMEVPVAPIAEPVMEEAPVAAMSPVAMEMTTSTGMVEPKLELFKLPDTVAKGEVVYFKGKLSKGEVGLPKVKIRIFEHDRSFMLDAAWAMGYTIEDGSFNLATKVSAPHFWDDSAKVYAQADGGEIKGLKSEIQKITIK